MYDFLIKRYRSAGNELIHRSLEISTKIGWNEDILECIWSTMDAKWLAFYFTDSTISSYTEFLLLYLVAEHLEDWTPESNSITENVKSALYALCDRYISLEERRLPILCYATKIERKISTMAICYNQADIIWRKIYDVSSDINFYTKRLILGAILYNLFLSLSKNTINKEEYYLQIDRGLAKARTFAKYKSMMKTAFHI
ncbi:hypothetical protein [Candidatus Fokinia crypta]|uniref:Ubiquinone biosynthesis protein COQ9 family protein n=1 Tax=Candidatus Fokinia crypta TaxID=1920990 RepID=A0ABZ0UNH1_9RICK|nr:hypothetical protein [Candidatus Fokinia cryptica]WPX97676.1 Ubiquinone biosynthesis protein COQ9 family protein [Candidatus Fokinia cryptica]